MIENYLQVLEDSLQKKISVLSCIEEQNKNQEKLLKESEVSIEAFELSVDEKGKLIDALNILDDGFEQLYERIKQQLVDHNSQYKEQIKNLQILIEVITEKSIAIQTQEARNKRLAESYFKSTRKEIGKNRLNAKAALDYYKNMNQSQLVTSQFMDKKK